MLGKTWRTGGCRGLLGWRQALFLGISLLAAPGPAFADRWPAHYDNFGGVGLLDMPSARMAPDGQLLLDGSFMQNTQHYNLGFQLMPWLETSFRYSGIQSFYPVGPSSNNLPVYYDRSFAMKLRLVQESAFFPSVAVGANDVVGTGVYGGEYVVASKQFGPVDATLGMGWGRLASTNLFKNPLVALSSSFADRPFLGTAGAANANALFHGPKIGLFGGISWATPVEGLTLLAEYSSDTYALEQARGSFLPRNQMNIGAAYDVTDSVTLGANWMYGKSFGANVALHFNPKTDTFPQRLGPQLPEPRIRSAEEQQLALNTILRRRVGRTAPHSGPDSAALVDTLWRDPEIRDVTVRGSLLSIAVARGDITSICESTAQLVGRYGITIAAISVQDGQKRTRRCAVQAQPQLAELTLQSDGDVPYLGTPALATIDAGTGNVRDQRAAIAHIRAEAKKQNITLEAVDLSGGVATIYYENGGYLFEADVLNRLTRLLMAQAPADIEKFRLIAAPGALPQQEFDVLRAPAERSYIQNGETDFSADILQTPAPMNNPVLAVADKKLFPRFIWSIFPQMRQQLFDPSNPIGIQFLAGADASLEMAPGLSFNGEAEVNIWNDFNVNRPSDSLLPHVRTDYVKYFTQGKNGIGDLDAEYQKRLTPSVFVVAKAGYLESMFAGAGGEVLWRPDGQRWAIGVDAYEVWQRNFDRLFGLQDYRAFTGHVSLYYASPFYDLVFALRAGQYLAKDRGITLEVTRRFATGVEIGAFMTKTNVPAAIYGEGSFDKGIIIRIPVGWALPIDTQRQLNLDLRPVQRDGGQRLQGDAILYNETRPTSLDEVQRHDVDFAAP